MNIGDAFRKPKATGSGATSSSSALEENAAGTGDSYHHAPPQYAHDNSANAQSVTNHIVPVVVGGTVYFTPQSAMPVGSNNAHNGTKQSMAVYDSTSGGGDNHMATNSDVPTRMITGARAMSHVQLPQHDYTSRYPPPYAAGLPISRNRMMLFRVLRANLIETSSQ
jgi:hypothetical protein